MLSMVITESEHNLPVLVVNYEGEVIEYDAHRLTKRVSKIDGVFNQINRYLAYIPKEDQTKFFIMIEEVLSQDEVRINDPKYNIKLKEIINNATDAFNFERFLVWFRANSKDVMIPAKISKVYEENPDKRKTTNKTYILNEYIDYLAMVLYFRAMLPFYIDFLSYCSEASLHPYLQTYRIFKDGSIYYEGSPIEKLEDYIQTIHKKENGNKNREKILITAGLSEDEAIDYFISESILKKVLLMDFFKVDANPIAHTYQAIKFSSLYKDNQQNSLKVVSNKKSTSDEEHPIFEKSSKTTNVSTGAIIELQWALKDKKRLLIDLGYDISTFNWKMYEEELRNVDFFMKSPVDKVQMYLLGWFLKSIVPPKALYHMEQIDIIELLLLAKVCLIHDNQEFIGNFLSCTQDKESNFLNSGIVIKGSLGAVLSKELNSLFKYSIDDKGIEYEKTVIDTSKHIVNLVWRPNGYVTPSYVNPDGVLINPGDMNEVIVDYVKYILNLGKKTYDF